MRGLSLIFAALFSLLSFATYAEAWNVLVVDAAEEAGPAFQFLSDNVKEVQGEEVNYTQIITTDLKNQTLGGYDVIWLGWNSSSINGNYYRQDDADAIADYVEAGGAVVTSASDDQGWQSDWLPASVTVLDTGDYDIEITDEGKELFRSPNDVKPADIVMDERYSAIDKAWTILAWGAGMENSQAGAMQIEHGKGLYLLVSIDTRNPGNTQIALPLMENMLNYAISYAQAAVAQAEKLATTWGRVKE